MLLYETDIRLTECERSILPTQLLYIFDPCLRHNHVGNDDPKETEIRIRVKELPDVRSLHALLNRLLQTEVGVRVTGRRSYAARMREQLSESQLFDVRTKFPLARQKWSDL